MNIKNLTKEVNEEIFLSLNDVVIPRLGKNTPFKSGDTAASWKVEKGERLGTFILRNTRGDIVHYLEEGTQSSIITPSTKKMLKFELKHKNGSPKQPKFRKTKDNMLFQKKGEIFFYNRAGIPVLGFKKEGNKVFVFARKVKHPGIKARHFVRETLNDRKLWKEFEKNVEAHIK